MWAHGRPGTLGVRNGSAGVGFPHLGADRRTSFTTMESPLGPHSSSPAELTDRLEAERAGTPFVHWRDPDGQRIVSVARGPRPVHGRAGRRGRRRAWSDGRSRGYTRRSRGLQASGRSPTTGCRETARSSTASGVTGRRRLGDGDELRFGATIVSSAPRPAASEATVAAPDRGRPAELTETQRKDPGRALPSLSRRQPLRDAGDQPAGRRGGLPLARRGQGPPAGPVREVRDRRPAAEPEAGPAGRAGAAQRRDLDARPRMSDAAGRRRRRAGGRLRVRRPPDRCRARAGRHGGRLPGAELALDRPRALKVIAPELSATSASASASGASRGSPPRSSTRT